MVFVCLGGEGKLEIDGNVTRKEMFGPLESRSVGMKLKGVREYANL